MGMGFTPKWSLPQNGFVFARKKNDVLHYIVWDNPGVNAILLLLDKMGGRDPLLPDWSDDMSR